jgi:hypothetical protein
VTPSAAQVEEAKEKKKQQKSEADYYAETDERMRNAGSVHVETGKVTTRALPH